MYTIQWIHRHPHDKYESAYGLFDDKGNCIYEDGTKYLVEKYAAANGYKIKDYVYTVD